MFALIVALSLTATRIEGRIEGMSVAEVRAVYNDASVVFESTIGISAPKTGVVRVKGVTAWKLNTLFPNAGGLIAGNYNRGSRTAWIALDLGIQQCTLFHEFEHYLFHSTGLSNVMDNQAEHHWIHQMEIAYNPECEQEDGS